jgi:hypothetical protein
MLGQYLPWSPETKPREEITMQGTHRNKLSMEAILGMLHVFSLEKNKTEQLKCLTLLGFCVFSKNTKMFKRAQNATI